MLIFASTPTTASAPIAAPSRGVKPRRKARANKKKIPAEAVYRTVSLVTPLAVKANIG